MENQYGIAVKNKFELFIDEDEDPLEILRLSEEAKTQGKKDDKDGKGKKNAKNEKDAKSAKNKLNKKVLTPVQEQKGKPTDQPPSKRDDKAPRTKSRQGEGNEQRERRPPRDRENREVGAPRQERPPRTDRQERTDRPGQTTEFRERGEGRGEGGFPRGRGARGGGRGRGEGRGRGRGGFDRFGKREFERHSGSDKTSSSSSGVKPVEKREGGGAHNWGTVKDDVVEAGEFNDTNVSEENADLSHIEDPEKQREGGDVPEGEEEVPEDESVREMTLDEWRAQQAAERNALKKDFNVRKPGEGCELDAKWKTMYVLKKVKSTDDSEESEEEEEDDDDHRHHQKKVLPIEITFNDTRRGTSRGRGGGRGRGGRGGFRDDEVGGRGRGGFRDEEGGGRGRGGFRDEEGGGRGRGGFRDRDEEGGGRGRGGFRDRGAPRGGPRGGQRGGGGGGNKREQAPDVENEQDFPALGS